MNKSEWRTHLRQRRQALSPQQQQAAARQMSQHVLSTITFSKQDAVALYLANDGEIDPQFLAEALTQQGITCWLPALHPDKKGHLWFGPYHGPRIENAFGIAEPDPARNSMIEGRQLDWVFVPLVGFDASGARLGMGGGFYDRTFEFIKNGDGHQTNLVGLAHHFQRVPQLPIESWDIPLTNIITD